MIADNDEERARRGFSLRRWSRRKLDASRAAATPPVPAPAPAPAPDLSSQPAVVPPPAGERGEAPGDPAAPLPPVESLDFNSDFKQFLGPKVEETVKRAALRKLFQDPRFNVIDGLDVYLDDYSIPDPIEPEAVRALQHAKSIFAPPKTRVNAEGHVEDLPPDEGALASEVPPELPEPEPGAAPMPNVRPDASPEARRDRAARDDGPGDADVRDDRRSEKDPPAA